MTDQWMPVLAARLRAVALGVVGVGCAVLATASPLIFGTDSTGDLAGLAATVAAVTLLAVAFALSLGGSPRSASSLVGTRNGEWTWDGRRWVHDSEAAQ